MFIFNPLQGSLNPKFCDENTAHVFNTELDKEFKDHITNLKFALIFMAVSNPV